MIQVRNLCKKFGDVVAVDDVTLEVRGGETLGLLGPNGAGKTTTIHLLVGTARPDSGTVEIAGSPDPTQPSARKKIGVAPQTISLYSDLTGEENLRFFGQLYGLHGARLNERVEWALGFCDLSGRKRDRVKTYSGGMQRRLNLGCALVHDPQVLFLDEPTVGVDPQSRNHIFERIEILKQEGRTILYTTHYMEEAQRLCDRVAIMDRGRILALDVVDALIEHYGGVSVIEASLDRPANSTIELPGVLNGTSLRLESQRPFEDVARLANLNLGLRTLNVRRPDLEAVFLALTGRRLRD